MTSFLQSPSRWDWNRLLCASLSSLSSTTSMIQLILEYLNEFIAVTYPLQLSNHPLQWTQCYWVGTPYNMEFIYDIDQTVHIRETADLPATSSQFATKLYPCSLPIHYLQLLQCHHKLEEDIKQQCPTVIQTIENHWRSHVQHRQQQWMHVDEDWERHHEQNAASESELTDEDEIEEENDDSKEAVTVVKPLRPHWKRPLDRFQDDQEYYASALSLQADDDDDDDDDNVEDDEVG